MGAVDSGKYQLNGPSLKCEGKLTDAAENGGPERRRPVQCFATLALF